VGVDLSVQVGSLRLKNPIMSASGCFGYGLEYAETVDLSTLGAVVVKGLFLNERQGHPPPRIVETPAGMLNAIGLQFITQRAPADVSQVPNAFGAVALCGLCIWMNKRHVVQWISYWYALLVIWNLCIILRTI